MQITPVQFKFKGSRDYIHGTDMYNLMTNYMQGIKHDIRFSVHDFVRQPACLLYLSTSKSEIHAIPNCMAKCQFISDDIQYHLALTQDNTQNSTTERYPYDESLVTNVCVLQDQSIILQQPSPYTFIETLVAMNKRLHEQLFAEVDGKWIFTRLDLQSSFQAQDSLAITLIHNMHYRLTKSDILHQGVKIGDIYFSLVKS